MKIKVSDYVIYWLENKNIDTVFGKWWWINYTM